MAGAEHIRSLHSARWVVGSFKGARNGIRPLLAARQLLVAARDCSDNNAGDRLSESPLASIRVTAQCGAKHPPMNCARLSSMGIKACSRSLPMLGNGRWM